MISWEWGLFMNILDRLKRLFYYRQHPEAALRYLPIVSLLERHNWQKEKILEVGSGSYGIAPYLKKRITGVDTSFGEPEFRFLKQVYGSADKLPFKSKKFDVVILSDVLEHLPKKIRKKSILEAVRVAKKAVIISGPFGIKAAKQDKELADYSLNKIGKMHPFFIDHLENGLPEVSDIYAVLSPNKRVLGIELVGRYFNLKVRRWLMTFFITNNKLVYYFYLKGLMPLVPFLRFLNMEPTYRKLLLARLKA